jgi:hypothetical protein
MEQFTYVENPPSTEKLPGRAPLREAFTSSLPVTLALASIVKRLKNALIDGRSTSSACTDFAPAIFATVIP